MGWRFGFGSGLGLGLHLPPCGDHVDEGHQVNRTRIEETTHEDGGNHHAQELSLGHHIPAPVGTTWQVHGMPRQRGMCDALWENLYWSGGLW